MGRWLIIIIYPTSLPCQGGVSTWCVIPCLKEQAFVYPVYSARWKNQITRTRLYAHAHIAQANDKLTTQLFSRSTHLTHSLGKMSLSPFNPSVDSHLGDAVTLGHCSLTSVPWPYDEGEIWTNMLAVNRAMSIWHWFTRNGEEVGLDYNNRGHSSCFFVSSCHVAAYEWNKTQF